MNEAISAILGAKTFAVVGASPRTEKYGYKVWRMLRDYGKTAYPINPAAPEIDGEKVYTRIDILPETPEAVIAIVPAQVTETLPEQLEASGIKYLWLQPGAESPKAVADAEAKGIQVVHGGPCILVQGSRHWNR